MSRGRYQEAKVTRRVFGRNTYNITLESIVDPERQLELSRERRANLILAEVLYSNNRSTIRYSNKHNPNRRDCSNRWGVEFSDSKVTPGKVTILDKKDDWDDDERSVGEIIIIQEKLAQNQQDFLVEYLPQWDDQLAIQKKKLEMKWENTFAAKRGEDNIVLHLSKNEEKDDDLLYLKFRKFKQLVAQIINKHEEYSFATAADTESNTSYQPPPDAIIGPVVYPLARQNPQPTYKQTISLVILKEEAMLLTNDTTSTIIHNGPTTGMDIIMSNACLTNKSRIILAIKSQKLYFPSTIEKLFAKLPPSLSKKIEESFKAKHHGLSAGVFPAIKFSHTFVSEMCKDAALAKELRDLSLCSAIPIPGYYKNNRKKYGIRKSRTYKGKPYNSHVKPFKRKYKDDRGRVKKCKCFICGNE
nr:hypothetical protein MA16_Dca018881 [Tanacetum cinerariifolium]